MESKSRKVLQIPYQRRDEKINTKKPDRTNNVYPVRLHMKVRDEFALTLLKE